MSIAVLIGIGLATWLMIYIAFKLKQDLADKSVEGGNNHFLLQLLILFFIIAGFILIGKATIDLQDNCAWQVANETTVGNITTYNNDYVCSANTNNTANIFYKGVTWFARLFATYIFLYIGYEVLKYLGWVVPRK